MSARQGRGHGRRGHAKTRIEVRISETNAELVNDIADAAGVSLAAFFDEFISMFVKEEELDVRGLPTWWPHRPRTQEELPFAKSA